MVASAPLGSTAFELLCSLQAAPLALGVVHSLSAEVHAGTGERSGVS